MPVCTLGHVPQRVRHTPSVPPAAHPVLCVCPNTPCVPLIKLCLVASGASCSIQAERLVLDSFPPCKERLATRKPRGGKVHLAHGLGGSVHGHGSTAFGPVMRHRSRVEQVAGVSHFLVARKQGDRKGGAPTSPSRTHPQGPHFLPLGTPPGASSSSQNTRAGTNPLEVTSPSHSSPPVQVLGLVESLCLGRPPLCCPKRQHSCVQAPGCGLLWGHLQAPAHCFLSFLKRRCFSQELGRAPLS